MKKLFKKIAVVTAFLLGPSVALAYTINGNLDLLGTNLNLGSAGVRLSQDGDGAITFLGLGNGSDEDLTWNFDDTSNTVTVTTSTGVTSVNFVGMGVFQNGNAVIDTAGIDTSAELAGIVTDETGSGALVFGTTPTLGTPVIGNFTNATHSHANAAGGGQLDWDNIWTDAIHSHQSNAEGGALNCAAVTGSTTGSGNCVKATGPSISSPAISGTVTGSATYNTITLSSPSVNGDMSLSSGDSIILDDNFGSDTAIFAGAADQITFQVGGATRGAFTNTVFSSSGNIVPGTTDTYDLGGSSLRFQDAWVEDNLYLHADPTSNSTGMRLANISGDGLLQMGGDLFLIVQELGGTSQQEIEFVGGTSSNAYFAPGADGEVRLGRNGHEWFDVWASDTTINTSDVRYKKDIKDSDLGLEFINSLRPVSYRWKKRDTGKHYGLIAQEVEKTLHGREFAALKKPEGPGEKYGLGYGEFTGPMIKAIQELTARIEKLEKEKGR